MFRCGFVIYLSLLLLEEKFAKSNSANAARKPHETQQKSSSSLGASLVDGARIFEELNRPGLYKPKFVYIFAGREKLV